MTKLISNCCGATLNFEPTNGSPNLTTKDMLSRCSHCLEMCGVEEMEENADLKDVLRKILVSLSYLSKAVEIGNIDLQAHREEILTIYQDIEKI